MPFWMPKLTIYSQVQRFKRSAELVDTRAGHYKRKLHTKSGEVELKAPKLRKQTFEMAIFEQYQRLTISVEQASLNMCLVGVSVRQVEGITECDMGNLYIIQNPFEPYNRYAS